MALMIDPKHCPQDHPCPLLKICPFGAITQQGNGLPRIDTGKCTLCGRCVQKCALRAVRSVEPKKAVIATPLCAMRDIYRAINDFEEKLQQQHGITLNEGMLLCSLKTAEMCSSGQLADLLGLSLSNTSKVIISAESKELIRRFVGKQDRRQMYFSLSDRGRAYLEDLAPTTTEVKRVLEHIGTLAHTPSTAKGNQ